MLCYVMLSEGNTNWSKDLKFRRDTVIYITFIWKLKVHYCVHKILSLVPVLNQINPVHTFPPYFH